MTSIGQTNGAMSRSQTALTTSIIERVKVLLSEETDENGSLSTPEIAFKVDVPARRIAVILENLADEGLIDRAPRLGNSKINRWRAPSSYA